MAVPFSPAPSRPAPPGPAAEAKATSAAAEAVPQNVSQDLPRDVSQNPAQSPAQHPAQNLPALAALDSAEPDTTELTEVEVVTVLPDTVEAPRPVQREAERPQPRRTSARPEPRKRMIERPATRRAAARGQPNRSETSVPAARASGGVGRGRSNMTSNYRGLVAAHLMRHRRFPSDARNRGAQGSATIVFVIDGGGRVTSVRLARGSGVGSLDQEATAMVRRASPFPAPPGGRGMSFSVPVSFRLN